MQVTSSLSRRIIQMVQTLGRARFTSSRLMARKAQLDLCRAKVLDWHFDSQGNVLATAGDGNIYKFTPSGPNSWNPPSILIQSSSFPAGQDNPNGLAIDGSGNLFVSVGLPSFDTTNGD